MGRSRFIQVFFMEIAMAILFFSLCATVLVTLFSKAALTSEESQALNGAVITVQSVLQTLESCEDGTQLTLCFDETWQETTGEARFQMRISVQTQENGGNRLCDYVVDVVDTETGSSLVQMTTAKYFRERGPA